MKCILVEYKAMLAYYYLWNPVAKRVIIATNVEFNEAKAPAAGRRPTNDTSLLLKLDLEAYIKQYLLEQGSVTIQKLAAAANEQLNMANTLTSLAKDLALLVEE